MYSFNQFVVASCSECGLAYLSPRLKESVMENLYRDSDYFGDGAPGGYSNYAAQEQSLRLTFRRFLGRLRQIGSSAGRLLEVGSGCGYFLSEAKGYFRERAGLELSPGAGALARQTSGAPVHIGPLSSLPPDWTQFDTIVMINVIEHVYRPVEFLSLAAERMSRGGCVVVATPDFGSFWHRLLRHRWPSFKIPEHVAYYTRGSLARLLKAAGFVSIREVPYPHAFPLALIAEKFGISVPARIGSLSVWLPGTMVAFTARIADEGVP